MRVVLEVGNKTVELENNVDHYPTAEEKKMFLELVESALKAVGYSVKDFFDDEV